MQPPSACVHARYTKNILFRYLQNWAVKMLANICLRVFVSMGSKFINSMKDSLSFDTVHVVCADAHARVLSVSVGLKSGG